MLKRLFVGLVLGAVVGAAIAAALIGGLGMVSFGAAALAYLSAAVVGLVCGLVLGKPIWAKGGQIEAGLKGLFGSLLAAGVMFALRQWGNLALDLSALGAGAGRIGDLPAASFPIIGALLGSLFELDNTGGEAAAPARVRAPDPVERLRAAGKGAAAKGENVEANEAPAAQSRKRR